MRRWPIERDLFRDLDSPLFHNLSKAGKLQGWRRWRLLRVYALRLRANAIVLATCPSRNPWRLGNVQSIPYRDGSGRIPMFNADGSVTWIGKRKETLQTMIESVAPRRPGLLELMERVGLMHQQDKRGEEQLAAEDRAVRALGECDEHLGNGRYREGMEGVRAYQRNEKARATP